MTSKNVPFGPPTFAKTTMDLNYALDFSLDSHPSIGPLTFEKTPMDLDDEFEFSLESNPSIGMPTFDKTPVDLDDAFEFSFESHPSIGMSTFNKTHVDLDDAFDFSFKSHPFIFNCGQYPQEHSFNGKEISLFVEEGGLDGERNIMVDHGKVKNMVNEEDIGDPSMLKILTHNARVAHIHFLP